jgi:hypothetical protein
MVAVFGRPKKEAKPDMRAEAVILELEWETDDKSIQIVNDAKAIMRMGMFGYVFVGVNDRLMTRWQRPDTRVIATFYWGEDEFHHTLQRMCNIDLAEFNQMNSESRTVLENKKSKSRKAKRSD